LEVLLGFLKYSNCCRNSSKGRFCVSINPDEAVAYGAAVQAALLSEDIKKLRE